MLNLINTAKKLGNAIRSEIELQKEIQEAQSKFIFLGGEDIMIGNHSVRILDDYVLANTMTKSPNMVVTDNNELICNQAFVDEIPENFQLAIIAHELGHIQYDHKTRRGKFYHLQSRFGFGEGIQIEYEADEYALNKGHDMVELMDYYIQQHGATRALELRRKRMVTLSKAK